MILFTSVTVFHGIVQYGVTFFSRADVTTHDGEYLRVTRLPIPPRYVITFVNCPLRLFCKWDLIIVICR